MRFQYLRCVKGFDKQMLLANKLNISRTTISMWEKGKSYPSIPMIHKIAKVFNCEPEIVFKSFEVKGDTTNVKL